MILLTKMQHLIKGKGTGFPELFDVVQLNEVLGNFYIGAGKPNGEKHKVTFLENFDLTSITKSTITSKQESSKNLLDIFK